MVKGFIDYLFEHDGRVYVCDWKSDSLPGWEPAGLAARCERDYAVQAQLYTLAAARLLGLRDAAAFERRFGGVLYCFLRGMRAGDPEAGVYFRRPDLGRRARLAARDARAALLGAGVSRDSEAGQLSPLGTVRRRLEGAAAGDYPFELLAGLRDADLGPESLFLAWQLAGLASDLPPADRRGLTALLVRVLIQVAGGSTRAAVGAGDRDLLARAGAVVGAPGARCPFILDRGSLYPQRLLACEDRLAAALRARRAGAPLAGEAQVQQAVTAVAAAGGAPPLSDEQLAAVRAALAGRLTVVSGGPGTGKTTIALAIVRGLARLGIPAGAVALAAPTGKAANRLEESIQLGLASRCRGRARPPTPSWRAPHRPRRPCIGCWAGRPAAEPSPTTRTTAWHTGR